MSQTSSSSSGPEFLLSPILSPQANLQNHHEAVGSLRSLRMLPLARQDAEISGGYEHVFIGTYFAGPRVAFAK